MWLLQLKNERFYRSRSSSQLYLLPDSSVLPNILQEECVYEEGAHFLNLWYFLEFLELETLGCASEYVGHHFCKQLYHNWKDEDSTSGV